APEIFSGGSLDGRTDLYSLGIILYQVTTSQLPFPSKDPVRVVAGHLGEEPTAPRDINPGIPYELNDLILDLLDKLPEGRPKNALEVKHRISKLNQRNLGAEEERLCSSCIYSGELIGREEELAKLEQGLKQSIDTQGRVFMLEGKMGIGKTALLDMLKLKAQFEGMPFLKTRCLENSLVPYKPIKEILYGLLPYLKNKYDFLLKEYNYPLSLLLPELVNPEKQGIDLSKKGKEDFYKETVDFLIKASSLVPFAICIDDLHMCGEETLDVLEKLVDNIQRSKILLCCFMSPRRAGRGTYDPLTRFKPLMGKIELLKLRPLSLDETKRFLSSRFPRPPDKEMVSLLYTRTKGNPFILTEWLKLLLENRIIRLEQGDIKYDLESLKEIKLSCSPKEIILKNLDRYEKKLREILHLCIFMGGRIGVEELVSLTAYAREDIERALTILSTDQWMTKTVGFEEGSCYYELIHQDIPRVLADAYSLQEKEALHQRVAKYLNKKSPKKPYPPVEMTAYHFTQSGDHEKGFEHSLQAADRMRKVFAYQKASYWLKNAYGLIRKFSTRKQRLEKQWEVAIRCGDLCRDSGQEKGALRDYHTALRSAQLLKDKEKIAEALQRISSIYDSQKDIQNAFSFLKRSLEIYQELKDKFKVAETCERIGGHFYQNCQYRKAGMYYRKSLIIYESLNRPKEIAGILNSLGVAYILQGKFLEAKEHLRRFIDIAQKIDDKEMCSKGLNNLAVVCFSTGRYSEGIEYVLASLRINEEINNQEFILFNLVNLGSKFTSVGRFREAISYTMRCLELARQVSCSQFKIVDALLVLGESNSELGNYSQALKYLQEALESAEQINVRRYNALVSLGLTGVYIKINQLEKAEELLASAEKTTKDIQDKNHLIFLYEIAGLLNLKKGRFNEAIGYLNKAKQLIQQVGTRDENILVNLLFCEIYFESGELDKANKTLRQTQSILEKSENKRYEPQYYLSLAKKEWWGGKLDQALRYFEVSLAKAEKQEIPELIWRIHHQIGKLSLSMNNLERAYKELRAAQKIIKELSAKIGNENMKKGYLEDKEKIELLSDIRSVVELMMGEKVVQSLG
ncbi:MAG: tetratricopeptide repeat protein, partial [candidate division Zixibacteria bacterium]|nr:tetratricopeptide repeat protein [candidate division Zixibacteria bacterium]